MYTLTNEPQAYDIDSHNGNTEQRNHRNKKRIQPYAPAEQSAVATTMPERGTGDTQMKVDKRKLKKDSFYKTKARAKKRREEHFSKKEFEAYKELQELSNEELFDALLENLSNGGMKQDSVESIFIEANYRGGYHCYGIAKWYAMKPKPERTKLARDRFLMVIDWFNGNIDKELEGEELNGFPFVPKYKQLFARAHGGE